MTWICSFGMLLGRICLSLIFLFAGVNKILNFHDTQNLMIAKGVPFAQLSLLVAIAFLILGGLFLIFGYKTRSAAFMLILFLIPTTYYFHNFWNMTGQEAVLERITFFRNVGLLGGLLYVLSCGSGGCGYDGIFKKD